MADERGGGRGAGPFATAERARDCTGSGLAAGRVGAAFRLRARCIGAPVRSQREVGIAAAGIGGTAAGSDPAAGARRQGGGAGSHEVPGASGPPKPGGLPADGGDLRPASLRYPRSRPTVCRLAPRFGRDPQAHSGCSGLVFQGATTDAGESSGRHRCRTVTRSGEGGGDCEPRPSATGGGGGYGGGSAAIESRAVSDRAHSKATASHRRGNPTGEKTTC
jgi:hypothetical protein